MTRFLCTGDLHLGAGTDYGREPGDRLRDQQATWQRILELADEHDVDAILFAGDAFHRRRPTPAENLAFQTPLRNRETFEILCIDGNHDVESAELPSAPAVFENDLDLRRQPGVWHAPGGVSVVTLPWTPVGRLVAAQGGGDRAEINRQAAEHLLAIARGHRAAIDGPAILMLHYSVAGGRTPTGASTDTFPEVVLPLEELASLGYQAVVCGHIHLPQILHGGVEGLSGPVFYVGSPDVVDFGEAESQHGVWILDIESGETAATPTWVAIEGRRFKTLFADFTDGDDFSQLIEGYGDWSELDGAVVRVRYRCTEDQVHLVDRERITRAILDLGAHKVYAFEPTIVRAARARLELVDDESLTPLTAVDLWCEAQSLSPTERDMLMALSDAYFKAVAA